MTIFMSLRKKINFRLFRKVHAVGINYLRRVRRISKKDKVKNTQIRNVEIEKTVKFIERIQSSWWRHLQRMNNFRPTKQIWEQT